MKLDQIILGNMKERVWLEVSKLVKICENWLCADNEASPIGAAFGCLVGFETSES